MSLENHIKSVRKQLDVDKPDNKAIWEGVSKELNISIEKNKHQFWKAVAIFTIIISASYIIITATFHENDTQKHIPNDIVSLQNISPELGEMEVYYTSIITNKINEVETKRNNVSGEYIEILYTQMEQLDKDYDLCKKDLMEIGFNERIIQAIIEYYINKIKILEKFLEELKKTQNYENNEIRYNKNEYYI